MQIDKNMVLNLLKQQGKDDQASQADSEMPDQVDTEKDAGLLQKFGVNPADLVKMVTGGGTGGLGGMLGGR